MTSALSTPPTAPPRPVGRPRVDRPATALQPGTGLPWLCPVPDCEPPFDDELTSADRVRGLAGRSARRVQPLDPRTATPTSKGPGRGTGRTTQQAADRSNPAAARQTDAHAATAPTMVRAAQVPGWSRENDVGVELTSSAALPRADRIGWMLAQALVEVLAGARPLAQLRAFCAADVFAGLEDQKVLRGSRPPRLVTARVHEPADGVAEVAAVFRTADRVRAMAFRIRGIDGRWRITDLQIG